MKKISVFLLLWCFINCVDAQAKSVILMIGDGMGFNHIKCVNNEHQLFLSKLDAKSVTTYSYDNAVTDSAASATAYSCGIKTKNYFLGLDPKGKPCETIAEQAAAKNKEVYISTTDDEYGATPSAFYAHTSSRYDNKTIDNDRAYAQKNMHLHFNVDKLSLEAKRVIDIMSNNHKKEYFVMLEGAKIDKASHKNDYAKMTKELQDFDKAVQLVWEYAHKHNVAVIITADHETGGLNYKTCDYTTYNHSGVDVPLYMYNVRGNTSMRKYNNVLVYKLVYDTLFAR